MTSDLHSSGSDVHKDIVQSNLLISPVYHLMTRILSMISEILSHADFAVDSVYSASLMPPRISQLL